MDCLWQKYKHKDIGFTNIEIPLGNKLNLLQRRQGDGLIYHNFIIFLPEVLVTDDCVISCFRSWLSTNYYFYRAKSLFALYIWDQS